MRPLSVINFLSKGDKNARKFVHKIFTQIPINTAYTKSLSHFFKKLFWLIIYLLGCVLTIVTCYDAYETSSNHPVSISSTNFHNDTISLPDSTICLPFFHANEVVQCLGNDSTHLICENDDVF